MDERAVRQAMSIDDAYVVERRLAKGPDGTTELVSIDGAGPFVRRRMPIARVRRAVWAALADCQDARLPHVRTSYELPDEYVVVLDYAEGETFADLVVREVILKIRDRHKMVVDAVLFPFARGARGARHALFERGAQPEHLLYDGTLAHPGRPGDDGEHISLPIQRSAPVRVFFRFRSSRQVRSA